MIFKRECMGAVGKLAILLAMTTPLQCFGQSVSQTAVNKAHEFLKTDERGKQINSLLHFGTTYSGHEFVQTSAVKDAAGKVIPGEFALVYRFWWDEKYSTDLAIFCTPSGSIDSVKPLRSDGVAQAPFLTAQATISILGNTFYEVFKEKMSDTDKRQFRKIIDQADVKALLEMQLKLQQVLGR